MHTGEDNSWNRFRQGEQSAFDQLMRLHYKALFNYGTKLTHDSELVKDCLQDLFLDLWKNHQTLKATACVRAYLLKSLRRKLYRQLYRNQWRRQTAGLADDHYFELTFSIETSLIQAEQQADTALMLTRLLNKLPKRQKEILYLRFYQELSINQLVDVMGLSPQSTYNLLHKALQRLRQELQGEPMLGLLILALLVDLPLPFRIK